MTPAHPVYHLALRELYAANGARFTEANGWSLPADYGDSAAEYRAIRESAAVFDRSQRSRFLVTGTDAGDLLGLVFAGHVGELEEGRAMRSVRLDAAGCIRDLPLIARTGGIAYLVTGEPGQRAETFAALRAACRDDFDVRIDDRTETTCLIGLTGPTAAAVAAEHLSEGLPGRLPMLNTVTFEFHGFRSMATRASDTGEDGFEFVLAPAVAQHIVETLVAAGVPLVGEAALRAARVEACIPAYAPDLEAGSSPAEADLDVLLGIPGGAQRSILCALLLEGEATPSPGTPVLRGTERAGTLGSCVRSPSLGSTIALAAVDARLALPGTVFDVAGTRAVVVAKPFYRRRSET